MKRILFILVLMTLCVSFSTYFLAAEQDKTGMKTMIGKKMMSKTMDNERKQMMEMCPMHTKMMKNMMSKFIVATEDNGVVVMIGNKLFKYDKNLKLKNEAELKIDMEAMHKKMMEIKEKCPMCHKMMEKSDKTMLKDGNVVK